MRKNVSPSKKKYQGIACKLRDSKASKFICGSEGSKLLPKEELDQKISLLKCKKPTDNNKSSIISCMDETFSDRRNWINNSNPTISQIFDLYPCLLDYDGEMIDIEFERMHQGCENNFLSTFPSYYTSRILAYAELHRPDVYKLTNTIKNENLRALHILIDLLLVSNAILNKGKRPAKGFEKARGRKRQRVDAEKMSDKENNYEPQSEIAKQDLIRTVPEGTNLSQYVENRRNENNTNVQPYILCVRGQQKDSFFIQGDGWFISNHDKANPIVAFDVLFKCYYVLNLTYPPSLKYFYDFMEYYVYEMVSTTPRSIVSSVHINITNVQLNSDDTIMSDEG